MTTAAACDINALRTSPLARACHRQLRSERMIAQPPNRERLRNFSLDKLFQLFLSHVAQTNTGHASTHDQCYTLTSIAAVTATSRLDDISKLYELGLKLQRVLTTQFDGYEAEWSDVVCLEDNPAVCDIFKDEWRKYSEPMLAIAWLFLEISGILDVSHYWEKRCARDSRGEGSLTQLMLTIGTIETIIDILEGNDIGSRELYVPNPLNFELGAQDRCRLHSKKLSSQQKRVSALVLHRFICQVHDQIAANQPLKMITLVALLPLQTEVAKIQIDRDYGHVAAATVAAYFMIERCLHDLGQSYGVIPGLNHDLWLAFGDNIVPNAARRF